MFANPREATFEEFCRHSRYSEKINQLPEWPFASEGFSSTFLLICLPGFLLLLKEVFLEAFVSLITK